MEVQPSVVRLLVAGRGDSGQVLVELVVLLPAIVVSIVLCAHVLIFVAECAKFDRAVCEYGRANVGVVGDPVYEQGLPLDSILGYTTRGPFSVSVVIEPDYGYLLDVREHEFTLKYQPIKMPVVRMFGGWDGTVFTRRKTLAIPHYKATLRL